MNRRAQSSQAASRGAPPGGSLRVIGLGNRLRGDDAAGLVAAERLRRSFPDAVRVLENAVDPGSLVAAWSGARDVIILDAARSGAPPGTIHHFEAAREPLPSGVFPRASTHALGLAECVELARALGVLPSRLQVYGIEGAEFGLAEDCSEAVRRAADRVAAMIRAQMECEPHAENANGTTPGHV